MAYRNILVVDDESNMRNTLAFILEAANYRVTTVENGHHAIQEILQAKDRNKPIELIITDIMMPDINGLELIDEIKRLNLEIPILVITAYGNKKMINTLKQRSCTDYLAKPFEEDELLNRVAALIIKKTEDKNGNK